MTFLLWLLFTALAVGIPPGFIARQLTKGRGRGVEDPRKTIRWGLRLILLVVLAGTGTLLVISWAGPIDAPWLITGLILGAPASGWASKKWYRSFKDGNLMGS